MGGRVQINSKALSTRCSRCRCCCQTPSASVPDRLSIIGNYCGPRESEPDLPRDAHQARLTMFIRIRDAIRRRSTLSSTSPKKSTKEQSPVSEAAARDVITPSAAQAVLKTPELLELVLAHLDQEELLRAQRVCRRWKDMISSSLPLRRMLYLAPTLKIDERIPVDNAWLKSKFPELGIFLLQGNPKWRPKFVKALAPADFERLGTEFFAQDASWRDMLLTQPPVKEIVVYSNIEDSSKPFARKSKRSIFTREQQEEGTRQPSIPSMEEIMQASVTVKHKNGVTMGMIVDAGIEARRRGSVAAKRRMSDRKDSGYVSLDESQVDDIEVSVVEIVD